MILSRSAGASTSWTTSWAPVSPVHRARAHGVQRGGQHNIRNETKGRTFDCGRLTDLTLVRRFEVLFMPPAAAICYRRPGFRLADLFGLTFFSALCPSLLHRFRQPFSSLRGKGAACLIRRSRSRTHRSCWLGNVSAL